MMVITALNPVQRSTFPSTMGLSDGTVWGCERRCRLHLSASGKQVAVKATGGGAYKFQEEFREQLGIELQKQDEMRSLVAGSDFFLRAIEDEVFTFQAGVVRSLVSPRCMLITLLVKHKPQEST